MLLNNFFNTLKAGYRQFAAGDYSWQSASNIVTAMDGASNNGWFYAYSSSDYFRQISYFLGITGDPSAKNNARIRIAVGTGDNAPTPTDYKLTNAYVSAVIQASNYAKDADGNLTGSAMITNTSDTAVTYKEIGAVLYGSFATSSSSRTYRNVLVSRELLASPITLQPGESATVTITFAWK